MSTVWGPENRNVWITFKPDYGLMCLVESEYDVIILLVENMVSV